MENCVCGYFIFVKKNFNSMLFIWIELKEKEELVKLCFFNILVFNEVNYSKGIVIVNKV